ncbi:hypothetical protein [Mucilaginibacter sp. L3T2-6]|uniref:hypothetical protein n=1 Tax=Mucilaginibacter sp. L3T2-6 TaxID=3062491 RepID=UPI0026764995|nr:hypothetical protein [Mucilaginibacter sp. L3T2-6]MDO3641772.1 hypothetical protein [Mucilaginibacter sp. L3T2-6]MDV6214266.1 hypothetical protein [Mucilaginibacter sp. L3T2-6]
MADPLLKTIAHLKQRQIHRDQYNTYYQPQKYDDQRFQHAAEGAGFIFTLQNGMTKQYNGIIATQSWGTAAAYL